MRVQQNLIIQNLQRECRIHQSLAENYTLIGNEDRAIQHLERAHKLLQAAQALLRA